MDKLASVFPGPPGVYQQFTNAKYEQFKKNPDDESLSFMKPPEPPVDAPYRSFGSIWQADDSKLQSLDDIGIVKLYKDIEPDSSEQVSAQQRMYQLKKLVKSLLVKFVDIIGTMSIAPEEFPSKVEQVRIILINIHHLLNEYRPHQSRELLILLMEEQIATKQAETKELKRISAEAMDRISKLTESLKIPVVSMPNGITEKRSDENPQKTKDLENWAKLGVV